jgi:hypothetical protein
MKKFLLIIFAFFFLTISQSTVKAQHFQDGDFVANLGLGFGWYGYGYGTTSFPAIILSMEKGVTEVQNVGPLSIGGVVTYKHANYNYTSVYDWTWNDIVVAVRGALYYDLFKVEKLDTYGAAALGLRFESWNHYDFAGVKASNTYTHGLLALYLGARYHFSDRFGAFAEVGYGYGYLNLGLSYKFN